VKIGSLSLSKKGQAEMVRKEEQQAREKKHSKEP